jgi:hypothetical protein
MSIVSNSNLERYVGKQKEWAENYISGLPVGGSGKGGVVKIGASTKWIYAASDNSAVGDIIDVETHGTKKYYVIRIR